MSPSNPVGNLENYVFQSILETPTSYTAQQDLSQLEEQAFQAIIEGANRQRSPAFERVIEMMKENYNSMLAPKTETRKFITIEKTPEYQ